MISIWFAAMLVGVWLLLWGTLSVANVLSGIAVASIIVLWIPELRLSLKETHLRPVALGRFVGLVVFDLLRANWVVTREILTRGSNIRTGIVEIELPDCSDEVVTVVSNVLGLAPGTMPIEVRRDPVRITIHVLHLHDLGQIRNDVYRLTELAIKAFGSEESVAALGSQLALGPTSTTRRLR